MKGVGIRGGFGKTVGASVVVALIDGDYESGFCTLEKIQ